MVNGPNVFASTASGIYFGDSELIAQNLIDSKNIDDGSPLVIDARIGAVIDDVRIYNRALSAAEVKSLYKYESKPPVKTGNNLLRKLAHFLRP